MPYDTPTKPVVDAVNDAVSALTDLVRSLRATAKAAKKTKGHGGKKAAKANLGSRLERAWEVFAHGKGDSANGTAGDEGASRGGPARRGRGRRGGRARSADGESQG